MARNKARNVGQVIEITPEKFTLRLYLGTDSAGKRHYHNETFHGKKTDAETGGEEGLAQARHCAKKKRLTCFPICLAVID